MGTPRHHLGVVIGALFLVIVSTSSLRAQFERYDTRGRSFWLAFMPNYGSGGETERSQLKLFVTGPRPTTVRLTHSATSETRSYTLQGGQTPLVIHINEEFGDTVELHGDFDRSYRSFHLEADDDVSVMGLNSRDRSADGFLVYPEDVLRNSYMVLAYPNGYDGTATQSFDMPSQFAIVSADYETTVYLTLRSRIPGQSDSSFSIDLDKGEVFLAQTIVPAGAIADLSGSVITANGHVAVFAGTRRASVPTSYGNFRDHLVEQVPPLEAWGRRAILTPHVTINPDADQESEARVVISTDGTILTLPGSGAQMGPYAKGAVVRLPLSDALAIEATAPILAAQYERSSTYDAQQTPGMGDPFMMIVPPQEDFDSLYHFVSFPDPSLLAHYVNIVVPAETESSIRIDGIRPNVRWIEIPGTDYSYAQIEVVAGAHEVTGVEPFGLYVYGFGGATSYGYTGGIVFRTMISSVEVVDNSLGGMAPLVRPNPATGRVAEIEFTLARAGSVTIDLVDARGIVVRRVSPASIESGRHSRSIDIGGLPAGVYTCRLTTGGGVHTARLVVTSW